MTGIRNASDPASNPAPGGSSHPPSPAADPPSVRAILSALHIRQRMTDAELRRASGLPRRTVYEALRILHQRGLVEHRKSLQDARQTYHWLAEVAGVVPFEHGDDAGPLSALDH